MSYVGISLRVLMLSVVLLAESAHGGELCFEEAGLRYNLSPVLLKAIATQESRLNPLALNKNNANGSFDMGIMQINSSWFDELAEFGISPEDLWQPCLNIHVGAWILAQEVDRFGYNWLAVGAYHAKDHVKQSLYVEKIIAALKRIAH